jgi:4,5-dihydroxyphthalate decarboxylase
MDIPATGPVTLKTNLAEYNTTMGIRDGRVSSRIVTLDCCGPKTAHDAFKDVIQRDMYDASELAIVTYLQARAFGKPYVALPAPVNGRFQHHCIGFNSELGDLKPKDIEGKRVGVRSYTQTTGLWVRGVLQHEYGVDLDKVTWCTLNDAHLKEYTDPANTERLPKGSNIPQMMLDGEFAAAILGNDMPKDPRVKTLIPNPHEAAKEWYAREHVLPINHLFVVHADIAKKRPDVVQEIWRMLIESRNLVPASELKTTPPIGFEENRKGIECAIDWSYEQGIIPRRMRYDELFDETTAALRVPAAAQAM